MNTKFLLFVYLIAYIIHISENEIKENVQYISYIYIALPTIVLKQNMIQILIEWC
jgi:ABC-type sulfate transport system permease component